MSDDKNITTAQDAWLKICTKLWVTYGIQALVDESVNTLQTTCEVTIATPAHIRLITNFGQHVLGFQIKRKELINSAGLKVNILNISWNHFGGGV
jgi:hypothetical protein